jgi:hypothetical protein
LPISAERPAVSEGRCVTLADVGLLSVPVTERNQGFGISCRGDGRPEGVVGLAVGEQEGGAGARSWTCLRSVARLVLLRESRLPESATSGSTGKSAAWATERQSRSVPRRASRSSGLFGLKPPLETAMSSRYCMKT